MPAQNGIRFHESQLWIDSSAESDVLREFAQVLLAKDPDCKSHNARTALKLCSPTSRPARLSGPWSTISTDLSQDARNRVVLPVNQCCIQNTVRGSLCPVPRSAFLHESWDGVMKTFGIVRFRFASLNFKKPETRNQSYCNWHQTGYSGLLSST